MPLLKDKEKRQLLRSELFQRLETGEDIATTIKDLRKILGMDQQAFAALTGIGLSTLRRIEQRSANYSMKSLQKILEAFSLELVIRSKVDH